MKEKIKADKLDRAEGGKRDAVASAENYQGITRIERWNSRLRRDVIVEHADRFIDDLIAVYKKHKLALGHEDHHGAFQIRDYSEDCVRWLQHAHDESKSRGAK